MHKRILIAACAAIASYARADSPPLPAPNTAIEFYHAAFDHYFITALRDEIAALDAGTLTGWSRTGRGFAVNPGTFFPELAPAPVCRFYIPPQHGDSHFFSASATECAAVRGKIGVDPNYSGYIEETPNAFTIFRASPTDGACQGGGVPIYRLWNQRADSNHRYTADPAVKAAMLAEGYLAEGYGPDATIMCAAV